MESKCLISVFGNIAESDLEWIYDPLAKKDRASEINTRTDVRKILREEYRQRRIRQIKAILCLPKRILLKIIRGIC